MPSPVLRYAITDRHLLRAHERNPSSNPTTPHLTQQPCHLDRSGRKAVAQWRDLHLPAKDPPGPILPTQVLCHLDRSEAQWRGLRFPATDLPDSDLTNLLQLAEHLRTTATDFLQLREKDLLPTTLRTLARTLRAAIPPNTPPRLLLNLGHPADHAANLRAAIDLHLDGLHLPTNTPTELPAQVRTSFAKAGLPAPILSISAHTPAELTTALAASPDLILFGPVFGKTVHHQPVAPALGIEALAAAVRLARPTPVLALGGITRANTPAALATGAAGIAGIRLFLPLIAPSPDTAPPRHP